MAASPKEPRAAVERDEHYRHRVQIDFHHGDLERLAALKNSAGRLLPYGRIDAVTLDVSGGRLHVAFYGVKANNVEHRRRTNTIIDLSGDPRWLDIIMGPSASAARVEALRTFWPSRQ